MKEDYLALSVSQLDEMGCCAGYEAHRTVLLAANPDPNHPFTLNVAIAAGCDFADCRDLLFPAARIAQHDLTIRNRLTCFINDCAILSLEGFETRYPEDPRPRDAIVACQSYLVGSVSRRDWERVTHEGLKAWAAFYAPAPICANGIWAAVSNGRGSFESWRDMDPDELHGWRGWAEWAVLTLKIHLMERSGVTEAETENSIQIATITRLAQWLDPIEPTPYFLPSPPQRDEFEGKPGLAASKAVGYFDLDWFNLAVLPHGVEVIDGIAIERNAFFAIPPGVTRINSIWMGDSAGEFVVPDSVTEICSISLNYGSIVILGTGVTHLDELEFDEGEIEAPNLKTIKCLKTRHDIVLPDTIKYIDALVFDREDKEDDEEFPAVLVGGIVLNHPATQIDLT